MGKPITEESIFLEATQIRSEADRQAYLDKACGDNQSLRAGVEALLAADAQSGDLLDVAEAHSPTVELPGQAERPGTVIGPYKLLQEIGEGGMGVVYMADQAEPVKRRVALKIIKPGMDSRQIIARFEAERQALAMMDHPNVARVLDAGATEVGRPYFVMELVKGIPITNYCDEHQLTPRERLELFLPVCLAVQHAHHKGIIHRDLKPSNVLIAEYDDQAVPKIIDFGVAKALNQSLTDKTMFTQYGQIVGTIEYMSPEQAKFNQLDVDTRSDIYSLGVLLYELLTGDTPLDKERLRSTSFDEVMRIIGEEEPPLPSTRLNTSETLPALADKRNTDQKRLAGLVKGELDWIVMRALEKDRTRRYQTAGALASDIEHYLNDEPVDACPPSLAYRLTKFVRRHKSALSRTAVAVAIVALTTLAVTFGLKYFSGLETIASKETESEQERQALELQSRRERKAREQGIAHVRELTGEKKFVAAFTRAAEVEAVLPGDPTLAELRDRFAHDVSIQSYPDGADVYWRDYDNPRHAWQHAGRTPIESLNVPAETLLWRVSREGYAEVIGCRQAEEDAIEFTLVPSEELPEGMVHVSGNAYLKDFYGTSFDDIELPDYFLDQYEVTNRQYQEFVNAGGYENEELWRGLFDDAPDGLTWKDAVKAFVDETGHAGPSTWRDGTFADGEGDYPVRGVSWYEATAYARFVGKQLPTAVHWLRASGAGKPATGWLHGMRIAAQSHIEVEANGPVEVGSRNGIGPFGTYDMAGNVAEWCANRGIGNKRYGPQRAILGGAWNDFAYRFEQWNAKPPGDRGPTNGIRCALYVESEIPQRATEPIVRTGRRDLRSEEPIDDKLYGLCRDMYTKRVANKIDLNVKAAPFETERFVHEKVEIDLGYGQQLPIHLLRPKEHSKPLQPIIYFPGIGNFQVDYEFPHQPHDVAENVPPPVRRNPRTGLANVWNKLLFLAESGRAVVYPVYSGSFGRQAGSEWQIHQYFELARTIDYLETRADMDHEKIGYVGASFGASNGIRYLALDDRIRAGVLCHGGLTWQTQPLPQYDPLNFAPRLKTPVLLINAGSDAGYPLNWSVMPMYDLIATAPQDKALILFQGGHMTHFHGDRDNIWKLDTLAWLDMYLGPVGDRHEYDQQIARANFAVVRGDWAEAAEHYGSAMELESDQSESWTDTQRKQFAGMAGLWAAVALVTAGGEDGVDGYPAICDTIMTHLPDAVGIRRARLLQACFLRPDMEVALDVQVYARRLADRLDELPEDVRPEIAEACALGNLRGGAPAEALELLAREFEGVELSQGQRALRFAIAALAHLQLGQPDDARARLADAAKLIDSSLPKQDDGTVNPHFAMRNQKLRKNCLIAEVLRREAEELLQRPSSPANE